MNKLKITEKEAGEYLKRHGLMKYLQDGAKNQLRPDYCDLARLHSLAVARKVFTILELGVGWSTVILADALRLNKQKWDRFKIKPNIRNSTPFKIFSVDASKKWSDNTKKLFPPELKEFVEFYYSDVKAGKFNSRMCHFFKSIPDIVPDFIYLDGPDPSVVKGSINGLSWKNPDRTVMSGDILLMEPTLLPGTFIIVDGRTNNARFLANNLQRNWVVKHNKDADITTMELVESPLGKINKETILYCVGDENSFSE